MLVRYKVKSPENGFTLVEIIASIVLLAIVISVFFSIFPQMVNWSKASEKELVSSNLSAMVAHEIYKEKELEKYPGLADVYKEGPKNCTKDNYKAVKLSASDIGTESYSKKKTINNVDYEISMKACLDKEEVAEKLMRVHFFINNVETGFVMKSFAFYNGDDEE